MTQQYMLSVHHRGGYPAVPPEEMQARFAAVDAFNHELTEAGNWVFGGGLMPPDTATLVDGRGAGAALTDGPFAETKEFLGGFWVITADNLDEALAWATRASRACAELIEVRPFQPEE
ncbi:YciI family protein [Micromonospora sp. WMMD882]|uniref:YciI family protein n=1 Tax=Micromonospora sp. WMMD882 TaxID=3015151 RepID=UPI00248CC602|nr:YciI family protein [Micromonospora sp. WMMD882]WBB78666.1 YciI family protein [Micromonospora sp. WMMD882]